MDVRASQHVTARRLEDPLCQNPAEVRDKGISEIVEGHHMYISHILATRTRCLHKNVGEILDLHLASRIE
jgi:hypothetical protein